MPKTPVPAADTGLPTRRRTLTALAGLGAALGLPGATQAAIPPEHPDAALLAMRPRIAAAQAALDAACDRLGAADLLQFAGKPSPDKEGAEAEEEAASAAWGALHDEIADMRATTLDGLLIKATYGDDLEMMQSITDDLLAIAGGAA